MLKSICAFSAALQRGHCNTRCSEMVFELKVDINFFLLISSLQLQKQTTPPPKKNSSHEVIIWLLLGAESISSSDDWILTTGLIEAAGTGLHQRGAEAVNCLGHEAWLCYAPQFTSSASLWPSLRSGFLSFGKYLLYEHHFLFGSLLKTICPRAVRYVVSWRCWVRTGSSKAKRLIGSEPHRIRFSVTWVVLHLGGPACWGWGWCWWHWTRWSSMGCDCNFCFSNCCLTSLGLSFFVCIIGALDIVLFGS